MSPPERDQGTPELAVCFDEEEEDFVEENEVQEISENGQEVWNVTQSQEVWKHTKYPATCHPIHYWASNPVLETHMVCRPLFQPSINKKT